MSKDKKKYKVQFGESSGAKFYKEIFDEIYKIFGKSEDLFVSDSLPIGLCLLESGVGESDVIYNKRKQYCFEEISKAFGCKIPDNFLKLSVVDACEYLDKNRTIFEVQRAVDFLGALGIQDLQEKKHYNLTYVEFLKSSVDYKTGFMHNKSEFYNPLDKDTKEILKELEFNRLIVYGDHKKDRWKIETIEGDILLFKNLYQVHCWMIARASNYQNKGLKEDW